MMDAVISRLKYEHKSVKVLRGTDGAAKWAADGWEVIGEETGKLRTTLQLRRARTREGWLKVIGPGATFVVIAAVVGVGAALEDDEPASVDSAQSSGEDSNESESAEDGPITAETNEEFAALLGGPERGPSVAGFVDKYLDDHPRVEFEGFVVQVYNSDYDQQDALVQAGTAAHPTGPRFNIGAYYTTALAFRIEELRRGQSVRVSGSLGIYEHDDSQDTFTEETRRMLIQLVEAQVKVLR